MDFLVSCREKLTSFRIKELKDVLTQLGLSKQGKKQDLVDRILALLSDDQDAKSQFSGRRNSLGKESVAKIVEDTYRKLQHSSAMDLASKSHSSSDFSHVKPKEEADSYYQVVKNVRCPCGSSSKNEDMVQCVDSRCCVWQHVVCVIIPEKPAESAIPGFPHFYCEICRINRADPFWVTMGHPLLPVRLITHGVINNDPNTIQTVEKTFQLSRADKEMLQKPEYDIQVWCLLLNDKVPFRMQWPQHTELQVNGVPVRVVNRAPSQLLGINGRDDGPVITTCSREGVNKIRFSRGDTRSFCFGIRLARRRTVQQVLSLIPKEADGEHLEDALARIRRCIGGGAANDSADNDSDLEVVADSVTVSLRCPMSGSRIRIAGRFKPCVHTGCFDLETFVELNQRSRKWQCPICLKNFSLENLIIDPYFNRITSMMRSCIEDVTEIDVRPDGSWRAKNENESRDLAKWHLPDGSLCPAPEVEVKPNLEKLKQIKQEGNSEGNTGLRIGMKRNRDGVWEISKPEDFKLQSLGNHSKDRYENNVPMSSSASGSYRDDDDPSVNQEVMGNFELSMNNSHELDSFSLNFDPVYNIEDRIPPAPSKDPDVIVLSDSDDDNLALIPPETVYQNGTAVDNGIHFTNHEGVSERYPGESSMVANGVDLFGNTDDFGMPLWTMQNQTGSGFQLFGTETEIPEGLVDSNASFGCGPITDYDLTTPDGLHDNSHVQDLPALHPSTEMNGSLVDNPIAFASDDPSLQIFLPSRPAGGPLQVDLSDHADLTGGIDSDDWISLRLTAGGPSESTPADGQSSRQFPPNESRIEPSDEDDSLPFSTKDNRVNNVKSNNRKPDSSLSHPQQPRSVKPRVYFRIDTDSD